MLVSRAWWPAVSDGGAADPARASRSAPASPAGPALDVTPSPRSPGVRCTAILLDDASRAGLLTRVPPAFAHVTADHLALTHAPNAADLAKLPMGATALLAATGVAKAGGVQAATIKALPTWLTHAIEPGCLPHITVSADIAVAGAEAAGTAVATSLGSAGGGGCANSPGLTRLVPPVGLKGTVGVVMKDGTHLTSWTGERGGADAEEEAMPAAWSASGPPSALPRCLAAFNDSAAGSSADDGASSFKSRDMRKTKFKAIYCRTWAAGKRCPYGKECMYAHGADDLLPDPSKPGRSMSREELARAAAARQERFEAAVGKGVVGGRDALEKRLKSMAAAAASSSGDEEYDGTDECDDSAVTDVALPVGGRRARHTRTRRRRSGGDGGGGGSGGGGGGSGGTQKHLDTVSMLQSPGSLTTRQHAAAAALRAATLEVERCERVADGATNAGRAAAQRGRAAARAVAAVAEAKVAKLEAEHWANVKNACTCAATDARKRGQPAHAADQAGKAAVAHTAWVKARARAAACLAALADADPTPGAAAKATAQQAFLESQHFHNMKNQCNQLARNARARGDAGLAAKLVAAAATADMVATQTRRGTLAKVAADAGGAGKAAPRVSSSENGGDASGGGGNDAAPGRRSGRGAARPPTRTALAPVGGATAPPKPTPGTKTTPAKAVAPTGGLDGVKARAEAVKAAARAERVRLVDLTAGAKRAAGVALAKGDVDKARTLGAKVDALHEQARMQGDRVAAAATMAAAALLAAAGSAAAGSAPVPVCLDLGRVVDEADALEGVATQVMDASNVAPPGGVDLTISVGAGGRTHAAAVLDLLKTCAGLRPVMTTSGVIVVHVPAGTTVMPRKK